MAFSHCCVASVASKQRLMAFAALLNALFAGVPALVFARRKSAFLAIGLS